MSRNFEKFPFYHSIGPNGVDYYYNYYCYCQNNCFKISGEIFCYVTAIATALLNLGHAQSDIGDVEEAERNLTKAMDIYVALHGKNHRIVAAILNYLGYVYQQMGMVQEGKEKLERAVEIMKNSDFHPGE